MPPALARLLPRRGVLILIAVAVLLPLVDLVLPADRGLTGDLCKIWIIAILGLGLQVILGFTGLLHLGAAGFVALGVYAYAIATCAIYPFQVGFLGGLTAALLVGGVVGALLCLPLLRLRGDYLAIVTLGFGEIVQDCLRNLDVITKGTQGINPLPAPTEAIAADTGRWGWYYLLAALVGVVALLCANLRASGIGRSWLAVREDELAARAMGIRTTAAKLSACVIGSMLCALAGALYASFLRSSGEPGNYDFNMSVLAICVVIVGGLGSVPGAVVGAAVMVGFIDIVLTRLAGLLAGDSNAVFLQPGSWKYLVLGLALVLVSRFRPQGLWPERVAVERRS